MSDAAESTPPLDPIAQLVRGLAVEEGADAVLQRVVDAAQQQIEGAADVGVTILGRDDVFTPVATGERVRAVDAQQYRTGEGPCLTAAAEQAPIVVVQDLQVDERWPAFAAAVTDLDVRSMLSFQLYTDDRTIGALNVYSPTPNAFSADSIRVGALLAAHAAGAAIAASKNENLRIALESRDIIGQAKGILMERYKITGHQAFELLVAASQHTHRKLNVVATDLTTTGSLSVD